MYFDGAYFREGDGARVFLKSPKGSIIPLAYKLEFDITNNISKYEASVLGLQDAIDLRIECLRVFGYSELIVKQIKN